MEKYIARARAFELAEEKFVEGRPTYGKYSPIYIAATSNVKDMLKLYDGYENVLSVGGTGAIGYEALLNGAKHVDLFDINELQRIFFEYMQVAIKYLSYEEFVKYFTLKEQKMILTKDEIKDLLSQELYWKLVFLLPEDVETVLSPLFEFYDSPDLILSALFKFEHPVTLDYLKRYVSFYNEEEYYKLQKILRKEDDSITYRTVPLSEVPNTFKGQYDLILLDNILQYYKDMTGLDSAYDVNMFLSKKLGKLLSEKGVIQANYDFEINTDTFKRARGIKSVNNGSLISKLIFEVEKKENLSIPLVNKWDNYSYDFIQGVEENQNHKADNMVLTYRRRENKLSKK